MLGHSSSFHKPDGHDWIWFSRVFASHRLHGAITLGCLTAILALCTYLLTIAPDITWSNFSSDGGELITAAVTLGIPHPPGYPTYILLGKLISLLPAGTVAFRFNLLSALSASVAAGFVTATAFEYLRGAKSAWSVALATGVAFALAPLVWSQAVVTEVYAFNLALLAAFLWALLGRRSAMLTGVLLGLAITTHLTSIFMLPIAVVLTRSSHRLRLVVGIILGLSPLLTLPILAKQGSPVVWGDPSTLQGWLWLVSGQLYKANLNLPKPTEFMHYLSSWSKTTFSQFAFLGWLFVVIGIAVDRQGTRTTVWLLITAALYALFSFVYGTADSVLFLMPTLLLLSPILATGLTRVGRWSLLLPLIMLLLNFNQQSLREDHLVRPLVEKFLGELPKEAILLTPGDQSIFTLWYFKHVEGQRPDLLLVDSNLLAFDWYREQLKSQHPELEGLSTDDLKLFQTVNAKIRPFCTGSLQSPETVACHRGQGS